MTVKKALKILGLKAPYTEDDLKKTYRALIIMTHPDSVSKSIACRVNCGNNFNC